MPQDITIKITDRDGIAHEVVAPTDMNLNVMELIRMYELAEDGTVGTCGGMAMGDDEEAMLSEAFYVKSNSRLGCQIPITESLEGLELELAPEN